MRRDARNAALWILLAAVCLLMAALPATAQWSRSPGETVRDDFGPLQGERATVCRGACGRGCPSSCDQEVVFECLEAEWLRRIEVYECGTHQGCRDHDDCLDRCLEQRAAGFDCQAECHRLAIEKFGFEQATSWAAGSGPFDGEPIVFEYTRDGPGAPQAAYRCPAGARRDCAGSDAVCVGADGTPVEPVFDSYPDSAVLVSDFRSGKLCSGGRSGVSEEAVEIAVRGEDRCDQGATEAPCTRYGFEFDYRDANPALPLVCSSTGADEDFLGGIVAQALGAAPADRETDLGAALGHLQDQLASGSSLQDVLSGISVRPHGQSAKAEPATPPPPPPPGLAREIALDGSSGHLVVPMYELAEEAGAGTTIVRRVLCTQGGVPVVETEFRLRY
ncbi:MAG: hypothetical protein R3244_04555 [Thermoanaerobaculia bacterium]|nr:hypothetical protein [Thermoanaerobaculia bacterium]